MGRDSKPVIAFVAGGQQVLVSGRTVGVVEAIHTGTGSGQPLEVQIRGDISRMVPARTTSAVVVTTDANEVAVINLFPADRAGNAPRVVVIKPSDTKLVSSLNAVAQTDQTPDIVLAIDPAGRTLAICGAGQEYIGIFDCSTGVEQRQVGCSGPIASLLLDENRRGLAGLRSGAVEAFDLNDQQGTRSIPVASLDAVPTVLEWLHLDKGARPLLVGCTDGRIVIFPDTATGWPPQFGTALELARLPDQPVAIVPSIPIADRLAVRIEAVTDREEGVCIALLDRKGNFDIFAVPIDKSGAPLGESGVWRRRDFCRPIRAVLYSDVTCRDCTWAAGKISSARNLRRSRQNSSHSRRSLGDSTARLSNASAGSSRTGLGRESLRRATGFRSTCVTNAFRDLTSLLGSSNAAYHIPASWRGRITRTQ